MPPTPFNIHKISGAIEEDRVLKAMQHIFMWIKIKKIFPFQDRDL